MGSFESCVVFGKICDTFATVPLLYARRRVSRPIVEGHPVRKIYKQTAALGVGLDNNARTQGLGKRFLKRHHLGRLAMILMHALLRDGARDALGGANRKPFQNNLFKRVSRSSDDC